MPISERVHSIVVNIAFDVIWTKTNLIQFNRIDLVAFTSNLIHASHCLSLLKQTFSVTSMTKLSFPY
jgi:hypothetical protein